MNSKVMKAGWYYVEGVRYCTVCRTRRCERQVGGMLSYRPEDQHCELEQLTLELAFAIEDPCGAESIHLAAAALRLLRLLPPDQYGPMTVTLEAMRQAVVLEKSLPVTRQKASLAGRERAAGCTGERASRSAPSGRGLSSIQG